MRGAHSSAGSMWCRQAETAAPCAVHPTPSPHLQVGLARLQQVQQRQQPSLGHDARLQQGVNRGETVKHWLPRQGVRPKKQGAAHSMPFKPCYMRPGPTPT